MSKSEIDDAISDIHSLDWRVPGRECKNVESRYQTPTTKRERIRFAHDLLSTSKMVLPQ